MSDSVLAGQYVGNYYSHLVKEAFNIAGSIQTNGYFEFLYQNIPPCTGQGSIITRGIKGTLVTGQFIDYYLPIQGNGTITEPPRGVNCQTMSITMNGRYQMGVLPNLLINVWSGSQNIGQCGLNRV